MGADSPHRYPPLSSPISPPWMGANISSSRSLFQLLGLRLSFHLHLINWPYARRVWPGVCQGFLLLLECFHIRMGSRSTAGVYCCLLIGRLADSTFSFLSLRLSLSVSDRQPPWDSAPPPAPDTHTHTLPPIDNVIFQMSALCVSFQLLEVQPHLVSFQ